MYASNVLNVQSTPRMLNVTLYYIYKILEDDGVFIANYPTSPRKMHLTISKMEDELKEFFNIKRIPGKNVIFKLTKKIDDE